MAVATPLAFPGPAHAALWPFLSQPAKPAPATPVAASAKAAFHIKGFRSAQFGMTQDQVLAAIATDFKIPADKVQITTSAQERTVVLTVTVDVLDPGPGPAIVAYIMGASSHKLARIGVALGCDLAQSARRYIPGEN
jgi:hypothetical protein